MSMAAAAVAEDIIRTSALAIPGLPLLIRDPSMDGPEADEACRKRTSDDRRRRRRRVHPHPQPPNKNEAEEGGGGGWSTAANTIIRDASSQLPAIFVVSILIFMMGIPFGAAFFPTELELPGKEILGLRMFLFSTMMAQLVLTYTSKFNNCVGLQMIENVPFYLELARITIAEGGGSGESAISTLFFLFGASSVIVGLVFYLLGRFELGRVLYFFPKHVLVGCIGGIGLFIVVTALEVSTNTAFSLDAGGIDACIVRNFRLLLPVLAFEVVLRSLMRLTTSRDGVDRYPLLGPIYYCCITPAFYAVLLGAGISPKSAEMEGYFFPPFISSGSAFDGDIFRIFTMVDPSMISWKAVVKCIPTILGLTAFSLIHVPINIPAFGVSELYLSLNILCFYDTINSLIVAVPLGQRSLQMWNQI